MLSETPQTRASKKVGDLLVIWMTWSFRVYIAEVVEESPLVLKVQESGPRSRLKDDDFVVLEKDSLRIQGDDEISTALLRETTQRGKPLISGLKRLGVEDGKLHEILPVE
ncbi:MAG TPA: hypothetical protein DEB13_01550 [Candidatus Yanofskybacteria bacterium]|nr:hypothetical protein [Candidatus Yanofskybacteria bacterium]